MEDISAQNRIENNSLKVLFQRDLTALSGLYPEEILSMVGNNENILLQNYIAWQEALTVTAESLGIKSSQPDEIPKILENATFAKAKKILSENKKEKIVFGIAGPGAVGKETIKEALGFETVVNTTTRPKRDYEKNGEHYNFVDDNQFKNIAQQDNFVISMERSGRGQYGIQKKDIEKVLSNSKVSVVEENPTNLTILSQYMQQRGNCEFIIIYILPPSPILLNLAIRLAERCQKTNIDFRSAIASTLNTRQLDEFRSVLNSMKNGANVIFAVNDKVDRVVEKIKSLVEIK